MNESGRVQSPEDVLRDLLREVLAVAEGCHDCIAYSDDEELFTRLREAGVWSRDDD